MSQVLTVRTPVLAVAYERHGDRSGWPVVLLHGFPYDVRCYDAVVPRLVAAGADVVVPYLRGYGPTRFLDTSTLRSGQQAALGHDLLDVIRALGLDRPIVAGYDWGGRAACIVAAVWPERVSGLVSVTGYNIQDIAAADAPKPPVIEKTLWYQYYLHSARGRAGLAAHRYEYARQLWQEWSPTWRFTDAQLRATAESFDNPDFVDVVVHSYRHRYGLAAGDPAYQPTEDRLAEQPQIATPTVVMDGRDDTVDPPRTAGQHARHFSELVDHRLLPCGHNTPRECPAEFTAAVLDLHGRPARHG